MSRIVLAFLLAPIVIAAPAWAGGVTEVVTVTVSGGPFAGTHRATATDGGCSYGLTGSGAWGNQLSEDVKDPKKLSSVQLIVPDAKKAAGGTTDFLLTVLFGSLMQPSADYTIDTQPSTRSKSGSGKVTVQDAGKTAKVTFSAVTAQGVKLGGTIDCKSVLRAG